MTQIQTERREARSSAPIEALHLQLVHAADVFDLDAFVLADAQGRLVATSTRSDNGDAIADVIGAFSPMLADGEATTRGRLALSWLNDELEAQGIHWMADDVTVREFYAGDRRLFLCAVGGYGTDREMAIYRVIFGARRIWKQAA